MPTPSAAAPQSVDRILSVLEFLAAHRDGVGLADLARAVGAPKSSLMSLLAGMQGSGHLARDAAGLYRLGPRTFSMAMRIVGSLDLASLARPVLEQLVAATGETALLGALAPSGDYALFIDKVESGSALRYTVSLGEQRDLYSTAIGKLLLAHLPPAQQAAYLRKTPRKAHTAHTLVDEATLRAELESIVREGLSQTHGEHIVGAHAMAAPVWGYQHELLAAIVIAGPAERMRSAWEAHKARLLAAAAQLSQRMAPPAA